MNIYLHVTMQNSLRQPCLFILAPSPPLDFSTEMAPYGIVFMKYVEKKSIPIHPGTFLTLSLSLSDRQISLKCVLQLIIGRYTPKYHTSFFMIFYADCNGNIFCMIFHDNHFMILHDFWTFSFLELQMMFLIKPGVQKSQSTVAISLVWVLPLKFLQKFDS